MKKLISAIFVVLCLVVYEVTNATENHAEQMPQDVIIAKAATANPLKSLHTLTIDKFAEIVELQTGGKIKFRKYYNSVLGDEQENVRQLRTNEIQLSVLSCGNLTPFSPAAGVLYLPYIFPDIHKAHRLFHDQAYMSKLNNRIAKESGARPLAWLTGGYRHITNSRHHIHRMKDLQDLTIRIPSVKLQLLTFRSWGIEPRIVSWAETYARLKHGIIDGQENPYPIIADQKFWEVQKYLTETHYMLWVGPILVSERWFKSLSKPLQEVLMRSAQEVAEYEWVWAMRQDSVAKQRCISMGMEVIQLDDEPDWEAAARAIWPLFYEDVGGKDHIDELLERIK